MKILLPVLALLLSASATADDYQSIVQRASETIHQDFDEDWSFTETASGDDVVTVGRYNALNPAGERWTLMTIDGRPPTDDEIDDYLDDKHKGRKRKGKRGSSDDDSDDDKRDNSAVVNFETLELLEETADYWLFSFIPEDDDDDDFMRHVNGKVKVIKNGHYVEYVDLRNEKPIKPATGVKISKFLTTLTGRRTAPPCTRCPC